MKQQLARGNREMAISKAELVRRESLSELRKLAGWFEAKHGLTITLLGG
jgi:predicted kinase